jgi:RNA polymerase sigma-70 factor (sigma-E family)
MDPNAEREFREFVAARSAALYRAAYLLTGQHEQAEDLVQGALARVALRWRRIRRNPESYARRILYHDQVSRWRRRSWGRETLAATVPERPAAGDAAADTDLRLALAGALRRLPPRQRAVLVLRFYEDLPEREAAALLDVSVGTIRSTTFRGLARLRALCPELDPTQEALR